jgi:hypothetical protein
MRLASVPATATGTTLDLDARMIPWLTSIAVSGTDLTWTEQGDRPYDGARFQIAFVSPLGRYRPALLRWNVMAPRGGIPRFPYPDRMPVTNLFEFSGQLIEDSQLDGYTDFKSNRRHLDVPQTQTISHQQQSIF